MVEKLYIKKVNDYLYVSDSPKEADSLRTKGLPVLIALSEDGSIEDFDGFSYFCSDFEDLKNNEDSLGYFTETYCRLKEIPFSPGETERLVIRELCPGDIPFLKTLFGETSVCEFMPEINIDETEEAYFLRYVKNMYACFGYGYYVFIIKDTGCPAGIVGFTAGEKENSLEAGFACLEKYRGKGYTGEALKFLKDYMGSRFAEVIFTAKCHPSNKGALRLCEKYQLNLEYF